MTVWNSVNWPSLLDAYINACDVSLLDAYINACDVADITCQ